MARSNEPSLKPAIESSTFWITIVSESLLVLNAILKAAGKPAINISPELTGILGTFLGSLYISWRHHNRAIVNDGIVKIQVAKSRAVEAKAKAVTRKRKAA